MASHRGLLVDLGSGDGAAIVEAARARPASLCVAIDTDGGMAREASMRAARPAHKGGLPNALFLVADARTLPDPFSGRVGELRIILPWGSLLRAVLAADAQLVTTLTGALEPGGRLIVIASVLPTDVAAIGPAAGGADLRGLADALAEAGLEVTARRALGPQERLPARSTWAKRLGIPARRAALILEASAPLLVARAGLDTASTVASGNGSQGGEQAANGHGRWRT